ncbi:Uma2 family endonuclease [Streptomyces sp. NPDC001530]|uniref:Uma2 family endonuclease n=1 Tax=Streptomyces sp. NPDC001530 TaxID=3364582 RepID=UPI00368F2216
MTVVENDRIAMATINEQILDEMFDQMNVPEGYKAEIVEGTIYMSPQRDVHWETIQSIVFQLLTILGTKAKVLSDVRIDFPGHLNGLCPDVAKLRDGSQKDSEGRWRYQDVEFIAEVISKGTAMNDYGPKKTAYALAEVPVFLIADPYVGKCRLFTQPKDGDYLGDLPIAYGADVDLTTTLLGLTLKTDEFPRD